MGYRGTQKGNYGDQSRRKSAHGGRKSKRFLRDTQIARQNFEKRSKRSQVQDLIRMAPLAPNLELYLKYPDKFD
jgi:hypothetical protein